MNPSKQIVATYDYGCFMRAMDGFEQAGKMGLGRSIMPRGGDNPDTPHAIQEKVYYTLAVIGSQEQVDALKAQMEQNAT